MRGYADSIAHLQAELERLDLLLRLHFERTGGNVDEEKSAFEGMYVSDEEVARLLRPGEGSETSPRKANEPLRRTIDERTAELKDRVGRTVREGTRLRFAALADSFELTRRELDALLLALGPEVEEKYETIFAYLLDDITATRPTAGLILRVLATTERERLGSISIFSSASPLVEHGLVKLAPGADDAPTLSREVYVDRRVVEFLLGNDDVDDVIAEYATLEGSALAPDDLSLEADSAARLEAVLRAAEGRPTVYYVHGPPGSGRGRVAEAIAASIGTSRLRLDAARVPVGEFATVLSRSKREARLDGAALQIENVDALGTAGEAALTVDELLWHFEGFDWHVFLTGVEPWTPSRTLPGHEFALLGLDRPSYPLRKRIWAEYESELPASVDADDLASKFSLTRGQVEDALFLARAFADGGELTPSAVYRGCRTQSTANLSELARKTETNYGWEDIVLPTNKKRQLREVEAHVTHRGTVYSDWGFEEKFSLGNGLSVLFSGPSGTGKTMAAEIIANNTGLDLYKVDIANVVNKYIGETEKNLGKIFDEAEHSNAILFFDEADALFGQRSEVSDAQDRYANVEVNYLLQRVEEHNGTVVLTTNFEQNIDDAFMRRLDISIDFPRPNDESRLAIWTGIFPDRTPTGDIDFEFLSSFDVTGGNIKNIAQTAAFLAADDGDRVEMRHVVGATKLELEKVGKLVNPADFGEYQELLVD